MRIRPKHVLVALLSLVLLAMAYSPLLRAGLLAADFAALLDPWQGDAKLLRALSLEASRGLWGLPGHESGDSVGLALRLEHLVYLLLAGVGLGYFVRRLLLPWSGSEPAKASGRAAALLFALHPLAVWSVADVTARGELLGLMFAIWSAQLFLRGRQDQRFGWLCLAFILAIAAGFSSWMALGLPVLLACCDLTSTHRYRPLRTRLRTALTTLVLFGLGVSLEAALSFLLYDESGVGPILAAARELFTSAGASSAMGLCAQRLGLLVLPANPQVLGAVGIVIAGAAFLLAMQPALLAARSAPRLWGWLLCGLAFAMLASLVLSLNQTLDANSMAGVTGMLPSIAVMAAGLGLGSTALSGPHRPYMAWVVVISYAALAHANARPWVPAARQLAELRSELVAPLEAHPGMRTVVLDPPTTHQGIEVIGPHVQVLMDRRLLPKPSSDGAETGGAQPSTPVGLPPQALSMKTREFLSLLYEPEFRAWLGAEALVIYPRASMWDLRERQELGPRMFSVWRPTEPSRGGRSWLQTLRSPALDLSPMQESALRVSALERVEPAAALHVSWRSQASVQPVKGRHPGSWRSDEGGSVGWFDLGSSLAWRLGGRVRSILFEEGLQSIEEAALFDALPTLGEVQLRRDGAQLWFEGVQPPVGFGAGALRLLLLDLSDFEVRSVPLEPAGPDSFQHPRLGKEVERLLGADHRLAWVLEYSLDKHTIARARGRF